MFCKRLIENNNSMNFLIIKLQNIENFGVDKCDLLMLIAGSGVGPRDPNYHKSVAFQRNYIECTLRSDSG